MIIRFENMRGQAISGGLDNRPPAYGARNVYAGSLPLSVPQSILSDASLPFSKLSHAPLHKSTVIIDAFVGALTGVGFVVAGFLLLFVQF